MPISCAAEVAPTYGAAMLAYQHRRSGDVERAAETVAKVRGQIADLEAQVQSEVAILESGFDAQTEPLEEISLRPKASDITVQFCGIAWLPFTGDERGNLSPAL